MMVRCVERSGFDRCYGYCVIGQDTLLSQCFSSPRTGDYKWVPTNCWHNLEKCSGVTCDGLVPCREREACYCQ